MPVAPCFLPNQTGHLSNLAAPSLTLSLTWEDTFFSCPAYPTRRRAPTEEQTPCRSSCPNQILTTDPNFLCRSAFQLLRQSATRLPKCHVESDFFFAATGR